MKKKVNLSCFKTYDVREQIGENLNANIMRRIARAVAQHCNAKKVIVGYDARKTSVEFAQSVAEGICDAGSDALTIGLSGTEEMYWAVTEFLADGGIEVTASHNPIDYNGLKIVKSKSRPLNVEKDFKPIKFLAEQQCWSRVSKKGKIIDISKKARKKYVNRVLSFVDVDSLKPLKILVNCGNGAAGPTFDAITEGLINLNVPLKFFRMHHSPDHEFPNGIPNPLLPENRTETVKAVKENGADFGIAFDGDFDRCFFFDEFGRFVPGEYMVGLLASIFLDREKKARIVHDTRVIWNTLSVIKEKSGFAVQSKTGHAYIKEKMRSNNAVYGGEMSAHHYFRDFAYCDSGMIPWLLVSELISKTQFSLGDLIDDRAARFPSSGEQNFEVNDADHAISKVQKKFKDEALVDTTDGLSVTFSEWRFNIRKSNTEPLVRLNVESKGRAIDLKSKIDLISELVSGKRI